MRCHGHNMEMDGHNSLFRDQGLTVQTGRGMKWEILEVKVSWEVGHSMKCME